MRLALALVTALAAGPLSAAPKPEVRAPDLVVPYRKTEQVKLKLEIFRPVDWKAGDQRPAVVFFFGGGWVGGSTKQFRPQATHLAKRGLVAICAEYRATTRPKTTPFEAVADPKAPVRCVWCNAKSPRVDPTKIISS